MTSFRLLVACFLMGIGLWAGAAAAQAGTAIG
jgi:hypothetical protein